MKVSDSRIAELSPVVKYMFLKWREFMFYKVNFNLPHSEIHAAPHCERVLLYSLIMGENVFGEDVEKLTALAHASVFHDTRRHNDYGDIGHGARAALYYQSFCKENSDIDFHPEAVYMMRYHDMDDIKGIEAIKTEFGFASDDVIMLYSIFKDSDALDRWRLGSRGLNVRYLRTDAAKSLINYSHQIVEETMPQRLRWEIESLVNKVLDSKYSKV